MEDVALMPYSSGTSGMPKGVHLTHHNIVANLQQVAKVLAISHLFQTNKEIINPALAAPGIVNLALLPFHFIYGTMLMNHTLYSGQTSVVLDTFYLKSVLRALADFNVNFAGLPPLVLHSLATNALVDKYSLQVRAAIDLLNLSQLSYIGTGGGPLNKFIAEKVESRLNCKVFQGYGMTESSPALAQPSGMFLMIFVNEFQGLILSSISRSDFLSLLRSSVSMIENQTQILANPINGDQSWLKARKS